MKPSITRSLLGVAAAATLFSCTQATSGTQDDEGGQWLDGKADGVASAEKYIRFKPLEQPEPSGAALYDLIPGRYDDTMSVPDLIRKIGDFEDRSSALRGFFRVVAAHTGILVEVPDVDAVFEAPERLTDRLRFDLALLDRGRQALLSVYDGNADPPDYGYQLPQTYDVAALPSTEVTLPVSELREVAPGVFRGWPRNPQASDDALRRNTILSEVLERLSINSSAPESDVFTVVYQGASYTDLPSFVKALVQNGHRITAAVRHEVADFAGLHARGADGEIHNVAAAAFNRTGVTDAGGVEAVLPMFHSEVAFKIAAGDEVEGVAVEGGAVFYQGVARIGFYCDGCTAKQAWAGASTSDAFDGEQALQALVSAGLLTDVVRTVARRRGLPVDGYAVTGVCNDSAAVVHAAATGRAYSYPMMMIDELLVPEIEARIASTEADPERQAARDALVALRDAIGRVPSDLKPMDSTADRALRSFPWQPGQEPFFSTEQARSILQQ